MTKVSVVIPFFQRKEGILRRALDSILQQKLNPDVEVHVVVVDDGSPVPAAQEIQGLEFRHPFYLNVISQENGGVAKARNTGLKSLDATTQYIAFIDSDDIWSESHLQRGVDALEKGYDFYFADNKRRGRHQGDETHCRAAHMAKVADFLNRATIVNGMADVSTEDMVGLVITEFPCQASTVIYRRSIYPDLYFDDTLKAAGEDVIFFALLTAKAKKICFCTDVMVECADGINMYFSNLAWDSPKILSIWHDQAFIHSYIKNHMTLSLRNQKWHNPIVGIIRREFCFHLCRSILKNKGKLPQEFKRIFHEDKSFPFWFLYYLPQVTLGKALKLYHPW